MPVDDCFAQNKGFLRPHSYCVRTELCGGTLEGSKRVAGTGYTQGEISMVLGVESSGSILSAWRRKPCTVIFYHSRKGSVQQENKSTE
jgi:hypothetical protein